MPNHQITKEILHVLVDKLPGFGVPVTSIVNACLESETLA